MASNQRILKAYERYDYNGRVVAGSLVLRSKMPKNGKWKELVGYECCNYVPVYRLFDVTADWSLTTPAVEDQNNFITFLRNGEDGNGNINSLTNIRISDFSLVDGRLTCMLSATGGELNLSEIDATKILSLGNITNLEVLTISSNLIAEMPSDIFSEYTSLKTLWINQLNIPVDLSSLVNLQKLYAYDYGYSTLDVSALVSLQKFFGGNSGFAPTSLNFTNLSNLQEIDVNQTTTLTTINVSGCTSLTTITSYNNPTLTTIIGLEDCQNVIFAQLNFNSLNQTSLDYIAVSLNDNGLFNGTLVINNNAGTLSPTGNSARLSLISRGWSVTT